MKNKYILYLGILSLLNLTEARLYLELSIDIKYYDNSCNQILNEISYDIMCKVNDTQKECCLSEFLYYNIDILGEPEEDKCLKIKNKNENVLFECFKLYNNKNQRLFEIILIAVVFSLVLLLIMISSMLNLCGNQPRELLINLNINQDNDSNDGSDDD